MATARDGLRLAEFQHAAVARIVERLRDPAGSRRFLLADEVGLGKTLVAAGVIEQLAKGRRTPLVVVYVCSNAEIAEQNRRKLYPEAMDRVRRVTELALQRPDREQSVHLYSFTPGTSLQEGTGLGWERRFVLYLLHRILDRDVARGRWREFFRCGVAPERWHANARLPALRDEYAYKVSLELQDRLAAAWRGPVEIEGEAVILAHVIDDEVARFREAGDVPDARGRRNRVVAAFRRELQRVTLDCLGPDLVVLDEVQRFRDVLVKADDPLSIAGRLFRKPDVAVLILSATPYKMLTLGHETEDHYEDLRTTLDFLRRRRAGAGPDPVLDDLERFRRRLLAGEFLNGPDLELRAIKERLEERLKAVMCRTERNWYIEEAGKGVKEVWADGMPGPAELTDFIRLRRALLERADSGYHITEYWKSGPSPLTFMDGQYAVIRALREHAVRLPPGLVRDPDGRDALADRNHRMRVLFARLFGPPGSAAGGWRHLWMRPTYLYYRDEFYGEAELAKYLIFSGWRFVPKAVAVLVSAAVSRMLREEEFHAATPLRFAEKRSFHVFDTCFPSVALAAAVDVAGLATEPGVTARDVLRKTGEALRVRLDAAGVTVGVVGNDPLWRIVARLEGDAAERGGIGAALRRSRLERSDDGGSQHFAAHRDLFLGWLADRGSALRISPKRLRRLAAIAAWSPAVSLLRAVWSVYPACRETVPAGLLDVCLGPLRNYLNRPTVQAIVNRHAAGRRAREFYPTRVLRYCRDAQVQAMLDEYLFLLRDVVRCATPAAAAAHLGRVLNLGVGQPKVNVTRPRGRGDVDLTPEPESRRTHFALAFGEEVADQGSELEGSSAAERKTAIREAFNSPFWPFVMATTSVGQEGLDFHLYCRDIVHWNLPSNPVDLEQREGRINRRDCLAIRQRIARDWPIARVLRFRREDDRNPWQWVFAALEQAGGLERYKHGLYPHWVYEGEAGNDVRIRRHLVFHAHSADAKRYADLKDGLALYRLVFGQPRQEDLLDRLRDRLDMAQPGWDAARVHAHLSYYMVNLSPFVPGHAAELADLEAGRIVEEPDEDRRREALAEVARDVRRLLTIRREELGQIQDDIAALLTVIEGPGAASAGNRLHTALRALLYLRNPYDRHFDLHPTVGLQDDIAIIREAYRAIRHGRREVSPRDLPGTALKASERE